MSSGTPLGRMMIELGLDDTSFGKGVDGAKKRVSYFSKEMQANMRIADLAGDKYGKLGVKFDGLTNIISAQQKKVEQLKKSYEGSLVDGKPTEQTAKLAGELQQANGQLANYNKQLANTAGEMSKWKIENEGLTGGLMTFGKSLEKIGGRMTTVGDKMMKGVTLPIVAGVGLITKATIDWESAFAGVKKTNDEVVDANGKVVYSYDDLEESLRGLTKVLPATHDEIANVAEAGGQLGIATEHVTGFTKTMIDLGESTNMSAEEAATALARLANITGLPQTEFDRLGSSIVDLGNNMATTESEITAMAMRLAGAGSQVGMTEADILGLSAALSSVGIEAEMGGSAISKTLINMAVASETGLTKVRELEEATGMTRRELELMQNLDGKGFKELASSMDMTTTELNKIIKSGKDLEGFAAVAGMTGEQFKKAFEDDAVGALGAFIEGLGSAEEKGTSAIELLDELGISEVRLRDSLLRAGNANELFADSIKMSNDAWEDNTALTEEAEKRYETMESQLSMLKNEVKDVAIDLGGPFVGAMRDGLEVAKPMIKSLSDLAKSFSDADPKTQKMIMKLIAYTVAAGPVLSVTGRVASGIGGMTTKTVGFLGVMAKKKTVAEFTKQLVTGSADIVKWGSTTKTAASLTTGFGTAAVSASGTGGVGAMTSALGALGPVALGIVGVGGVLAIGYGAWKLFGEEAYNSSQRVDRWGSDVGGVTDKALVTIQNNTQAASGQFELMTQGLGNNTDEMANNFTKIGESIEQGLIKRIEGLDALIKELPASVDSATKEMIENEKAKNESALQVIQENNDRISGIRKDASAENRELNISEAKIIQDLAKNTTNAYVETLDVSASEKRKILSAMTGDVASASEEEAKLWLQSLGKQRQAATVHMEASRKEKENYLEELGYNLDGEFAQKFMEAWDEINQTTVDGFDSQMATIVEKYPELMNEVLLANGQLISGNDDIAQSLIAGNRKIINDANSMATIVAENAEKNAERLKWTADESSKAGKKASQTWNDLVFDKKTGEVKSNARDVVVEATRDSVTWNRMRMVVHDANLDSNAKLIIGEAAIANGWWDGMAWEERFAILDSNSSETVIEALTNEGVWDELNFDEKKALLYSNTPEIMTETMFNLGLWDGHEPLVKDLRAENFELFQVLSTSEEMLKKYNDILPELKTLLADGPAEMTVDNARKALENYNKLDPKLQKLLANNTDAVTKTENARNKLIAYDNFKPGPKMLHINADTSGATIAQNAINNVPNYSKKMIDVVYSQRTTGTGPSALGLETGTNFHSGGLAMVNDQKGPLYKEVIERPNGEMFTVEGRDVVLPLERGSKVYTATQSKSMIPEYENGVGVPKDAKIIKTMDWLNQSTSSNQAVTANSKDYSSLLSEIRNLISNNSDNKIIKLLEIIANKSTTIDGKALFDNQSKYGGFDFKNANYQGGL